MLMSHAPRYRYELRLGAATVQTGILSEIGHFEVGDQLDVSGSAGVIRSIETVPGEAEVKLIMDLLPGGGAG